MSDLYATLGVDKTADTAAIRKAYRKAAKRAHPDHGGSPEAWAELSRAVAVLVDPGARKRYDETGHVEEPTVDTVESVALQHVMREIDHVLTQIELRGMFIDDVDVIGDAKTGLENKIAQAAAFKKKAEKTVERLVNTAGKFSGKPGKLDRIGPMLRNQAKMYAPQIAQAERDEVTMKRALEILSDHKFSNTQSKTSHRTTPLQMFAGFNNTYQGG